jgi:prepilin-type N-terminal cleavage/methylation domain-containing protein
MRNKKGFTLIELLVVIAIIGLLSTLAIVALQNARQKSRDAKRVSDIKQIQTALDLYFTDKNTYPPGDDITLGGKEADDIKVLCASDAGFHATSGGCAGATVYMDLIPANPTPGGAPYTYSQVDAGKDYSLLFELEGPTGGLDGGPQEATAGGIRTYSP